MTDRRKKKLGQHRHVYPVQGFVYCDKWGEVHETTGMHGEFDPYHYGAPEGDEEDNRCALEDHSPVYTEREP